MAGTEPRRQVVGRRRCRDAENRPGRARLQTIADYSADSLSRFVAGAVAPGAIVVNDGWPGYAKLKDIKHDSRVVGAAAAHVLLSWIHRLFANLKRWALGVYNGLRRKHLQSYLDELGRAKINPITYNVLTKPDTQG